MQVIKNNIFSQCLGIRQPAEQQEKELKKRITNTIQEDYYARCSYLFGKIDILSVVVNGKGGGRMVLREDTIHL